MPGTNYLEPPGEKLSKTNIISVNIPPSVHPHNSKTTFLQALKILQQDGSAPCSDETCVVLAMIHNIASYHRSDRFEDEPIHYPP
jgi:hypothetical protein